MPRRVPSAPLRLDGYLSSIVNEMLASRRTSSRSFDLSTNTFLLFTHFDKIRLHSEYGSSLTLPSACQSAHFFLPADKQLAHRDGHQYQKIPKRQYQHWEASPVCPIKRPIIAISLDRGAFRRRESREDVLRQHLQSLCVVRQCPPHARSS